MLGVSLIAEKRPTLWVAAAIIAVFAIFHGYAHGRELPPGESGMLYSAGFVVATGCLHLVGISIGLIHRWAWGRLVLRAAGAIVAIGRKLVSFRHSHDVDKPPADAHPPSEIAAVMLLCCGWPCTEAHLVTTGLGPLYDGIAHLALSPADLAVVVVLTLLAAMRGTRGRPLAARIAAGGVAGRRPDGTDVPDQREHPVGRPARRSSRRRNGGG